MAYVPRWEHQTQLASLGCRTPPLPFSTHATFSPPPPLVADERHGFVPLSPPLQFLWNILASLALPAQGPAARRQPPCPTAPGGHPTCCPHASRCSDEAASPRKATRTALPPAQSKFSGSRLAQGCRASPAGAGARLTLVGDLG